MKINLASAIPAIWVLCMPNFAFGMIVDKFKCEVIVKEKASAEKFEQKFDVNLDRIPFSENPAPDVRLTGSHTNFEMEFENAKRNLRIQFSFLSQHAMKLDNKGKIIGSKHQVCTFVNGQWCHHDAADNCNYVNISCTSNYENPFKGENYYWTDVDFYDDLPAFDERLSPYSERPIIDERGYLQGSVKVICRHLGTYR